MKPRILFVDDEPMVLSGIHRMLRRMRDTWEMDFVDRGDKALEAMHEHPYEVVVTDMRMPGMNGAELLTKVMQQYPSTVRIILSGFSDQPLIMKSLGATHQFLVKPCSSEDLKSTIHRATSLRQSFGNEKVFQVVSQMEKIPSLPTLYREIVEKLEDPDTYLTDIAKVIMKDIGMTTNILKIVNSAFFGINHHITDTEEAVSYLGLNLVQGLVLGIDFFAQFEGQPDELHTPDALWKHSLDVASLAKSILKSEDCSRKQQETGFVAGMLHDLGKLVLSSHVPEAYSEVLKRHLETQENLIDLEREAFEVTHPEVGSYLLGLWGLAESVVEPIALHHDPEKSIHPGFSVVSAVHAADVLVNRSASFLPWGGSRFLDETYFENIGMEKSLTEWKSTR